jgi:hypothetical protein
LFSFVAYFIFIEDVINPPHFTFFSEWIMKLIKKFYLEASTVVWFTFNNVLFHDTFYSFFLHCTGIVLAKCNGGEM